MSFWNPFTWFAKPLTMDFTPITGRITRYGYPTDSFKDRNSSNAIGCYDNELDGQSLAVSPDIRQSLKDEGIKLGGMVVLRLSNGMQLTRRWDDLTANDEEAAKLHLPPLRGRFDLFCPNGENTKIDGVAVTGFCKP